MQKNNTEFTPNINVLVNSFFDQVLLRDATGVVVGAKISRNELDWVLDGMMPPTVSQELLEKLNTLTCQLPGGNISLNHQIQSQWNKRLDQAALKKSELAFRERKNALSAIDQLRLDACDPDENPSAATIVAKMYLTGTSVLPRKEEMALQMLCAAAESGCAEAAYLLSTVRESNTPEAPFLVQNEQFRSSYRRQARAAGFLKEPEDERLGRWRKEAEDEWLRVAQPKQLKEELEEDPDYQILLIERDEAKLKACTGEPADQFELAMKLRQIVEHLAGAHSSLILKDSEIQGRIRAWNEEAHALLLNASPFLAGARSELARFAASDDERFTLLESAAFPENGIEPDIYALAPLACKFLMNPESPMFNPEKGQKCLREYLRSFRSPTKVMNLDLDSPSIPERFLFGSPEDAEAAICLADYLSSHASIESDQEAYGWYFLAATYTRPCAYAALRAALMALRGQGCAENLESVQWLLKRARESGGLDKRNFYASKYADALYRLGFQHQGAGWIAVDHLLELAEESSFQGDPQCYVTAEDIAKLVEANPLLIEVRNNREKIRELQRRIEPYPGAYGSIPYYPDIAQGLVLALQSDKKIPRESAERFLDDDTSLLGNYVIARLELAKRIIPCAPIGVAEQRLNQVRELRKKMLRDDNPSPPGFLDRERAEWLEYRATNHLLTEQMKEEKVKRLVEKTHAEVVENMLAMFAHKLRGPIDSILFNTNHHRDERIYIDAAQTMNGFMEMASSISASPERIESSCREDVEGAASPLSVLVHSLKQALLSLLSGRNRLRMSPHYLAYAKKQGAAPMDLSMSTWMREKTWVSLERELQSQWETDIGGLIATADIEMMSDWMRAHLLPLSVKGFEVTSVRFSEYGLKASLLRVIFQELLVNAIKHATPGTQTPLILAWSEGCVDAKTIAFSCGNPSTLESRRREKSKGSGRGHKFLELLAQNLGGQLKVDVMKNDSTVSFHIPQSLFKEDRS